MSKRILMVIAPQEFRDEELLVPRKAFLEKGWSVDTVSTEVSEAKGMLGAVESVSKTLEDITPTQYDAVVVVGGTGSQTYLWENARLHQVVQTLDAAQKVVSAICMSGGVLANAGVLKGKRATVWEVPDSLASLKAGGATYTGEPLTVDGHIITANGPEAAADFAKAIIAQVSTLASVG